MPKFGQIAVEELMTVRICARHQDQQADFEPGGRCHDASAGGGVAQVDLHGTDLATVSAAAIGGLLQRVSLARNQHQVQTRLGEKLSKFGADTLRAPGDEHPRPVLRGIDHRADERLCGRVHDQHVNLGPARDVGGHRSQ